MLSIHNNKGIALITALMLTLLSLTIVMALLYIVTQGTKWSAQNKKYRNALEASYAGTEILTKEVIPFVMKNYSSGTLISDLQTSSLGTAVDLQVASTQTCLQAKLTKKTTDWPSGCSVTSNPKDMPDFRYRMSAVTGNNFIVYSKIVDTTSGNTDVSGLTLEGAGVAESTSILTPQHFPYVYRIEIQGERETNAAAQANIEVLYAY